MSNSMWENDWVKPNINKFNFLIKRHYLMNYIMVDMVENGNSEVNVEASSEIFYFIYDSIAATINDEIVELFDNKKTAEIVKKVVYRGNTFEVKLCTSRAQLVNYLHQLGIEHEDAFWQIQDMSIVNTVYWDGASKEDFIKIFNNFITYRKEKQYWQARQQGIV